MVKNTKENALTKLGAIAAIASLILMGLSFVLEVDEGTGSSYVLTLRYGEPDVKPVTSRTSDPSFEYRTPLAMIPSLDPTLTNPAHGFHYRPGSVITMNYTESTGAVIVNARYYNDNGSGPIEIIDSDNETTGIQWDTSNILAPLCGIGKVWINVWVAVTDEHSRTGTSEKNTICFCIKENPQPCAQTITIGQGWNLISICVELDELGNSYRASNLAAEINAQAGEEIIRYVVKWDSPGSRFNEYIVKADLGKNFVIEHGGGYYVYSNSQFDVDFIIVGDYPECKTFDLTECWNLIGWESMETIDVDEFAEMIDDYAGGPVVQAIIRYDKSGDPDKYVAYYIGDSTEFKMRPGEAYWIFSTGDVTIAGLWDALRYITPFEDDHEKRALSLMANMNLSVKVGQMLMAKVATFDRSPIVEAFLRDGLVGGILVGRNSQTTDGEGVLDFTNWLQDQGGIASGVPLFMVGDFEGGKIMNYASLMSPWPNNMGVGATNSSELAFAFGYGYGTEIAALGFNMAFAPVLDVNTNPRNPVIGTRSFGSNPELVTRLGLKVAAGHLEAGIISTVKHFPGHGDTSVDSHTGLPVLEFNRTRLEQVELAPFRAAIQLGVPAIMTAHIAIPALDPGGRPATLSGPILTGLLREEMGFEGVIVTDSMRMGAITKNYGVLEAAGMAIDAGADILLYTGANRIQLRECHQFLIQEVSAGNITEEWVNESVLRILKLKLSYGLFDCYPVPVENLIRLRAYEHMMATREIANRSITLVNDTAGLLPLDLGPKEPMLVVSPDNLLLGNGNLSLAQYLADRDYNVSQVVLNHQVTSEERDEVMERAYNSTLIILATHHFKWYPDYYENTQIELAEALFNLSQDHSIPVVLLSVENPYDLRQLPRFTTRIVAYNSSSTTIEAVVAGITGEIGFPGELPVKL